MAEAGEQLDKLLYFNVRGRAEAIRIMYALAEQEFIDERLTIGDWITKKPGQVQ